MFPVTEPDIDEHIFLLYSVKSMTGCCCTSSEERANFSQTRSEIERCRFTSKEYDEETGLYYMSARYMNPVAGRWVSSNPAGWGLVNPNRQGFSMIQAMNPYSYCSNNPIIYRDPSGMVEVETADLQDRTSGRDVVRGEYQDIYFDNETKSIRAHTKDSFKGDQSFSLEGELTGDGELNSNGGMGGSIEGELSLTELDFTLGVEGHVASTEIRDLDDSDKRFDFNLRIEAFGGDAAVGMDSFIPQAGGGTYLFRGVAKMSVKFPKKGTKLEFGIGAGFSLGDGGFSAKSTIFNFEGSIERYK